MGRRLVGYVPIHEGDQTTWYGPDDKVPAKHAKLIGDHAWVDDETDDGSPAVPAAEPPPLGGPGSGAEAWLEYARSFDPPVEVTDDAKRDEIVEAIKAAGYPVE